MLVHRRSLPRNLLGFPNNLLVPIYTPGWRQALWELKVLPKNTTQCPRPGIEPGLLAPGTNVLTTASRPGKLQNEEKSVNRSIKTRENLHCHIDLYNHSHYKLLKRNVNWEQSQYKANLLMKRKPMHVPQTVMTRKCLIVFPANSRNIQNTETANMQYWLRMCDNFLRRMHFPQDMICCGWKNSF